jgi:hypothetical protein
MTLPDVDTEARPEGTPPPPPQRPPTPGGVSMGPAMVVVGLAVVILVVFVTIGVLTSQSPPPVRHRGASAAVPGSALRAEPAAGRLAPIVASGEPPTNILDAVDLPVGAARVSHQDNAAGSGQFDAQVAFRADASQGALLAFYAADMKTHGWELYDKGPAANHPNTLEVLGKLAGTDGYFWEMGVTIPPTSFGHGAPATGQTEFTIRLLQQNDDQS